MLRSHWNRCRRSTCRVSVVSIDSVVGIHQLNVLFQKLARVLLACGPRGAFEVVVSDLLHRTAFILTKLEYRIAAKRNL